ncbi:hypothetical protein PM03_14925 [Thalassobacter stenotrophicus]|nr:hypothetical protein PM03_14925 [Thalassobacter stenotrophicus]KGL00411.1 hypothetical protein PM04_15105 [Thalassobacter sp. 16PALIMAR09]
MPLNPVIFLLERCSVHQFLFLEPCYKFITSRYDGIAFCTAIYCFECKLCQMCHIRSLLFGYS